MRQVPYLPENSVLNQNFGKTPGMSMSGGTNITSQPPIGRTPLLADAITGLLTPGLVPDIARQSAEVSSGRGVGGSPAADSTAVRMSEQNWLQRLGLANQLLTGEETRALPYQITPLQSAYLNRYMYAGLGNQGRGGGGGYRGTPGPSMSMSMPSAPFAGTGFGSGPFGSDLTASQMVGGPMGSASGNMPNTLDEMYEWLGFGDFGSLPGDVTVPDQPGPPPLDEDYYG